MTTVALFGGRTYAATPPDSCFSFDSGTGTILNYYTNENNVLSNPACPLDVDIPTTISSTGVTAIGDSAFAYKTLTSVTIPNSVITIADNGFYSNQLTSVTIPNSVTTIGNNSFADNEIMTLVLGDSVATIGESSFQFNQLTTLAIPNSVITIGGGSFAFNNLVNLTLGNSVTTIDGQAFQSNQLTSVTIPNSVTSIDPTAFVLNGSLDSGLVRQMLQSGDPAQVQQAYDSIRLVNLYTVDASNPNNLSGSTFTEADLLGVDLNENGNQDDVLGGHLINPVTPGGDTATGNSSSSGENKLASTGQGTVPVFFSASIMVAASLVITVLSMRTQIHRR